MFPLSVAHFDYCTIVDPTGSVMNAVEDYAQGYCEASGGVTLAKRYRGVIYSGDEGSIGIGMGVGQVAGTIIQASGYIAHKVILAVRGVGVPVRYSRLDVAMTLQLSEFDQIVQRDKLRGYIKEDSQRRATVYRGTRQSDKMLRLYHKGGTVGGVLVRCEFQLNKRQARPLSDAVTRGEVTAHALLRREVEGVCGRRWYTGSDLDKFATVLRDGENPARAVRTVREIKEDWLFATVAPYLARVAHEEGERYDEFLAYLSQLVIDIGG